MLLTLSDIAERSHYLNVRQTLDRLLDWQVVPVINENDTTATDEITFGDNDFLAALVAALLNARAAGAADEHRRGLHRRSAQRPGGASWSSGSTTPPRWTRSRSAPSSQLGRGGMESKIASARIASESGVPVVICNGTRAGELARGGRGRRGRDALPGAGSRSSLGPTSCGSNTRSSRPASVFVDKGAARVLRESGSSLLPVGVAGASGTFAAGDAVAVVDATGSSRSAKASREYSAGTLRATDGHTQRRHPRRTSRHARGGHPSRPLRAALGPTWKQFCAGGGARVGRLPFLHGRSDQNHRRKLHRREARGADAGERADRGQGRGAGGDRAAARRAGRGDPRGERRRPRRRARRGAHRGAARPADADPGAGRGDGRGRAGGGGARRPGRRGARPPDAGRAGSTCARSGCRSAWSG